MSYVELFWIQALKFTVAKKKMLRKIVQDNQRIGKVKLRGAFGVQSEAEIMNLPCALISDKGQSNLCCN